MFLKKNKNFTTAWLWTDADNRWKYADESEKKVNDFISKISNIEGVKHSGCNHRQKVWSDGVRRYYYFTKVTFPNSHRDDIYSACNSFSLSYSNSYPFKDF